VLAAQRSVYAAEDQLVDSERNVAVSLVAIYKSLGGGWAVETVRTPTEGPEPGRLGQP